MRPRCLRFPLGLNIQTSLATSYWFSIPLNIALLLIEFTHHYQCLKESCPPLPAPPRCSLFSWRHISNFPCRSSTSDSEELTWKLTIREKTEFVIAACGTNTKSSRGESQAVPLFALSPLRFYKHWQVIYGHVPHLSVGTTLLLVYQCRWRSVNSPSKLKNTSLQPLNATVETAVGQRRGLWNITTSE